MSAKKNIKVVGGVVYRLFHRGLELKKLPVPGAKISKPMIKRAITGWEKQKDRVFHATLKEARKVVLDEQPRFVIEHEYFPEGPLKEIKPGPKTKKR